VGGKGFIGSYVVRDLVRQGKRVIAYDTFTDGPLDWLLTPEERREVVALHGDPCDFGELARVVAEHKASCWIHLVSMLNPASDENPLLAEKVNNLSFVTALEAARLWRFRLVWASSVVVFGPRECHPVQPIPNDAAHHPNSVYAACKSYNEFLANHYHKAWGVDHIGLRLTLVYGPGRTRGRSAFVNSLIREPSLGRPVCVPFGDDTIDWQYVEDVSRLFVTCARAQPPKTRIFNSQSDIRSLREAGQYIRGLLPGAQIEYQPGTFGAVWELDATALQAEIGFEWHYPMEKGILKTINFYRQEAGLPNIEG